MEKIRASVFADEDMTNLDANLDLSSFAPRKEKNPKSPSKEQVQQVSKATKFTSREPVVTAPVEPEKKSEQRRYRTGRNIQLNIKVSQQAHELFYKLNDGQNWVLGETFEKAVMALQKELNLNSATKS